MILPARICSGDLALRPLRLRDCRRFITVDRESGPGASRAIIPARYSWPGLWCWLRRRLAVSYGIEVNGTACGLIGLYDLTSEGSAHVALAIFDRSVRRKGIGSRAFSLLADVLRQYPIAGRLLARVRHGDDAAMRFWMKLGFAPPPGNAGGKTIILSCEMRQDA